MTDAANQPRWVHWKMNAKTCGVWFVISQVWAFAVFYPILKQTTDPANQYLLHWSGIAIAARFLVIFSVGLGLFLMGWLLSRLQPKDRVIKCGTIFCLLSMLQLMWSQVLANKHSSIGILFRDTPIAVVLVAFTVGISIQRKWTLQKWGTALARMALIFSPAIPIFWCNCLAAVPKPVLRYMDSQGSTVESNHQTKLVDSHDKSNLPANVFIFMFDAWSHRLTFEGNHVVADLPAIREFANTSCCFYEAHSPGCHTCSSMPRFLFQRTDDFAIKDGNVGFWNGESFTPAVAADSLFAKAKRNGYHTTMVGWYHDYRRFLTHVDQLDALCYYDHLGPSLAQRSLALLWANGSKMFGRFVSRPTFGDYYVLRNFGFVNQTDFINKKVFAAIRNDAVRQFDVFHMTLPHWPFCFDEHGTKPLRQVYSRYSTVDAKLQHVAMDRLVRRLLDELKQSERFDSSLIILTSDHAWRTDPHLDENSKKLTHVPLFIKFPHQEKRLDISAEFSTVHLNKLLEATIESNSLESIRDIVHQTDFANPLDERELQLKRPLILN